MLPNWIFISAYFLVVLSNLRTISAGETEQLVDEYYTITPAVTNQFTDQDSKDAQEIWDSGKSEASIASILLYREKIRRYAINEKILEKIVGYRVERLRRRTWITPRYTPQWKDQHTPFMDLCYGLIEDENVVLGGYLENFFFQYDRPRIVIGMTLTKDMGLMIKTYDENNYDGAFKDHRKSQEKPFENMLRVWVRQNREQLEKENLDDNAVKKDADELKKEQDRGCWHEHRDHIETITMKKSIKYARAVFEKFEACNGNKTVDSIINACADKHKLDADLANTYSSLARYIKDKHSYIASILHDNCDESNWWAAWVMCIAVVHPQEWPKVDNAFQKLYKSDANSLSDFIVKKLTKYKIMAEAIAVVVDSKFKPTTFKEKPVEGDPGKPPPGPASQ